MIKSRLFASIFSVAVFASAVVPAATTAAPLTLAPKVDIPRMYGGWYIVATIPNGFEKGLVEPYDVY